jgi:hypothetical protein
MQQRGHVRQTASLQDRLWEFVNGERARAESLPESADRNELLLKVRRAETAANIDRWANSPELQPPK